MENKSVIGIVRCSGRSQEQDGQTLPRQTELIKSYAAANNLSEPVIIIDKAKSGFKENRKGLKELKELCKSGTVSHVIFTDISRLTRNLQLGLELIKLFTKFNITFISLSESIDTSSANGKFQLHILISLAENYRNIVSDKMKMCWKYKRSKNEKCGGKIPYGFNVQDKKLIPNPTEQKNISLMVSLKKQGLSYCRIVKELANRNIPTKTGKATWTAKAVQLVIERQQQQPIIRQIAA